MMTEVVYDDSYQKDILEKWPNAKITDASDMIHESRILVEIPDIEYDEFWKWGCTNGMATLCLNFNVALYDKNFVEKVKGWLKEKEETK